MKTFSLAALCVCLAGCVTTRPSTQIQSSTKEPGFNIRHHKRVLVIGVLPDAQRRKIFEETVSKALKDHGQQSDVSYQAWPSLDGVSRQTIEVYVKDNAIDGVLITRVLDRKTVEVTTPSQSAPVPASPLDGAISYLDESSHAITPGQTVQVKVVAVETKLFETKQGKTVWVCRSQTRMEGLPADLIDNFANVMTGALYDQK